MLKSDYMSRLFFTKVKEAPFENQHSPLLFFKWWQGEKSARTNESDRGHDVNCVQMVETSLNFKWWLELLEAKASQFYKCKPILNMPQSIYKTDLWSYKKILNWQAFHAIG